MSSLLAFWKKLYAYRWFDRGLWTAAEFGVGVLTTKFSGSTVDGVSVGAALFLVKEFIASKLATITPAAPTAPAV